MLYFCHKELYSYGTYHVCNEEWLLQQRDLLQDQLVVEIGLNAMQELDIMMNKVTLICNWSYGPS